MWANCVYKAVRVCNIAYSFACPVTWFAWIWVLPRKNLAPIKVKLNKLKNSRQFSAIWISNEPTLVILISALSSWAKIFTLEPIPLISCPHSFPDYLLHDEKTELNSDFLFIKASKYGYRLLLYGHTGCLRSPCEIISKIVGSLIWVHLPYRKFIRRNSILCASDENDLPYGID